MRPAAHSLSFASPKESKQRKGDPAVRVPFAALRGNLRCSVSGRAAELTARCALRSNNCGKSVHESWRPAAPARPAPCAPRHGQKGGGDETGHRCARPRWAQALRAAQRQAERSDGPCRAVQPPGAAPGAGCLRGGHARRSAHASWTDLPRLSERSAPARSEFCGTPRKRPDPGLPRSASEGVADLGSPFLCLLSFGEAKESECAAGRISRPAHIKKKSCQRNTTKR